jgi:hypothetical protein
LSGKLMGKLWNKFVSIRDACIQLHNFAHNLHLKSTKNIVFRWN